LPDHKGNVAGAICGIVRLHIQILFVQLRVLGDLGDDPVLHGREVFAVCLPLSFPLLIILRFLRNYGS
jgi:hypothetical protein